MIKKIIVHAGVFHSDDVLTVAMAKYINPQIEIARVNQVPQNLSKDTIVADIGGGKYDHHQTNAKLREDGKKYAACGLFFKDFWKEIFVKEATAVWFNKNIIMPIEDQDNGGLNNPLSIFISSYIPNYDSEKSMDEAFLEAVDIMVEFIKRQVEKEQSIIKAEKIIKDILEKTEDKRCIILDKYLPWQSILMNRETLFVIYPSLRGGWNLQCVSQKIKEQGLKKELPYSWLSHKPKGCIFIHSGLFLASFDNLENACQAGQSLL